MLASSQDFAASEVFTFLEVIGTIAFAVSGVIAAARARMDWLGGAVLALVVAIGGGTMRDLLLGRLPVAWLEHYWPVVVAIFTTVVMLVIFRIRPETDLERSRALLIADAAGLSAFVVLGTQIGMESGLMPVLAVMLGVLTGVGGGVIRDVLTGERPMVLTGPIYAMAGIAGASCFVAMTFLGVSSSVSTWTSVAVVFAVRMLAIRFNWSLPLVAPQHKAEAATESGSGAA